jgi:hypothetical protein
VNVKDMISITHIPEINLEYALKHIPEDTWTDALVAESRVKTYGEGVVSKDIRHAHVGRIDDEFTAILREKVDPIVRQYSLDHNIPISKLEGYHVVRYEKGQYFKEHTDQTDEFPRQISIVLYINDDYEGGTITFTKIGTPTKPEASSLFVFPSNAEFSHSADPIISGTKYIVVGFWQ